MDRFSPHFLQDTENAFRCYSCVKPIGENSAVYMKQDQTYCSAGCRDQGRVRFEPQMRRIDTCLFGFGDLDQCPSQGQVPQAPEDLPNEGCSAVLSDAPNALGEEHLQAGILSAVTAAIWSISLLWPSTPEKEIPSHPSQVGSYTNLVTTYGEDKLLY